MNRLSWSTWSFVERCILIVIAVLPSIVDATCPDGVKQLTQNCRAGYDAHTKLLLGDQTFYSGIDVETIRTICIALRQTMQCAHELKTRCPDTHTALDTVLSDLKSAAELCVYPDLIDVYARNQNCFLEQRPASRRCYQTYHERQQLVMERIYRGDDNSLDRLCRLQETLLDCIRSTVREHCNAEATRLVHLLVRPSLKLSERCSDDSSTVSTGRTEKRPAEETPPYQSVKKTTGNASGTCPLRAHWLSGLVLATLTFSQTWRHDWS